MTRVLCWGRPGGRQAWLPPTLSTILSAAPDRARPRRMADRLLEKEPESDRREDQAAEESEPSLPDRRRGDPDRGRFQLPGEATHGDQHDGHAGAEGDDQAHAGSQAIQGRSQHEQAHRVPARDQTADQPQSQEAQVVPLNGANRLQIVLTMATEVTAEPPEAGG